MGAGWVAWAFLSVFLFSAGVVIWLLRIENRDRREEERIMKQIHEGKIRG